MYAVGWPLWKIAYRMGAAVSLRVDVQFDADARVFIATSPDLPGLVAEAETIEALHLEVVQSAAALISLATGEQSSRGHIQPEMHLQPA
jgi:hypothetical protein